MRYATFDANGVLNARYDNEITPIVPDGAMELSDELFFRTINEQDGVWRLVGGEVVKEPFPAIDASVLIVRAQARINRAYESAVAYVTAEYTASERESWPKQENEARAWLVDNNANTPWLDAAAQARGISKADLVSKITENADLFISTSGSLTGKRQNLRDQILALGDSPTKEQLDAIQW